MELDAVRGDFIQTCSHLREAIAETIPTEFTSEQRRHTSLSPQAQHEAVDVYDGIEALGRVKVKKSLTSILRRPLDLIRPQRLHPFISVDCPEPLTIEEGDKEEQPQGPDKKADMTPQDTSSDIKQLNVSAMDAALDWLRRSRPRELADILAWLKNGMLVQNLEPRLRSVIEGLGPSLTAKKGYYGLSDASLGALSSPCFSGAFGVYLAMVCLGRRITDLEDQPRYLFYELPHGLQVELKGRTGLKSNLDPPRRQGSEVWTATDSQKNCDPADRGVQLSSSPPSTAPMNAMQAEQRLRAAESELEAVKRNLMSAALDSYTKYLSAVASLRSADPENLEQEIGHLEEAAKMLAQATVVSILVPLAKTLDMPRLPSAKCRLHVDEKSLHLEFQIPNIFDVGGQSDQKTLAVLLRKLVALTCTALLKRLICKDLSPAIRRIYLDAYITKLNPFDGLVQRRYVASLSLNENNSDALFTDDDPVDVMLNMNARLSRDPRVEAIERIRPLVPSSTKLELCESADPSNLSPAEFEALVGNLFAALGFCIEQTKGSWDGGIDCIAADLRPLVGGKILIQAKRYAKTVDVSVVRDLYGLVISQGATKGVVVTTGRFGPTSHEFVRGKPLELIDGERLRELLKSHGVSTLHKNGP